MRGEVLNREESTPVETKQPVYFRVFFVSIFRGIDDSSNSAASIFSSVLCVDISWKK